MHPLLRAAADRQLGLFTTADARRAGYLYEEIRSRCTSGDWVRLRRGVYSTASDMAATGGVPSHRTQCLAVLLDLRRPGTVVSHSSAARLWGLPVRRQLDPTVRLTDPELWRHGRGFRMASAPLRPEEVCVRGPLRLTAPSRTLIDCAREWDLDDAVVAMDAALLKGLLTTGELETAAWRAKGWPGASRSLRAVRLADGRAESHLETRGRLRIVGSGLPTPELQVEIRAGGRLLAVVDAWFDDAAVAVEFDGRVKYTDPWRGRDPGQVLWEEKVREDDLRALDIGVVRITEADLGARWSTIETRLRSLVARPAPVRRSFTATPRERGRRRAG